MNDSEIISSEFESTQPDLIAAEKEKSILPDISTPFEQLPTLLQARLKTAASWLMVFGVGMLLLALILLLDPGTGGFLVREFSYAASIFVVIPLAILFIMSAKTVNRRGLRMWGVLTIAETVAILSSFMLLSFPLGFLITIPSAIFFSRAANMISIYQNKGLAEFSPGTKYYIEDSSQPIPFWR